MAHLKRDLPFDLGLMSNIQGTIGYIDILHLVNYTANY